MFVPRNPRILAAGDLIFAAIFVVDVIARILILKFKFWKNWINYLDVLVTIVSIAEIVMVLLPLDAAFFRLVRFGKLARTASAGLCCSTNTERKHCSTHLQSTIIANRYIAKIENLRKHRSKPRSWSDKLKTKNSRRCAEKTIVFHCFSMSFLSSFLFIFYSTTTFPSNPWPTVRTCMHCSNTVETCFLYV